MEDQLFVSRSTSPIFVLALVTESHCRSSLILLPNNLHQHPIPPSPVELVIKKSSLVSVFVPRVYALKSPNPGR
jgi:hypothetical protein